MKKHPVDDLFKGKLTDLERKPSAAAWLKVQEKQQPRRQVIGWVWYAAATVLVGVLGGYLIWQNSQSGVSRDRVLAKVRQTDSTLLREPTKKIVVNSEAIAEVPHKEQREEHLPAQVDYQREEKAEEKHDLNAETRDKSVLASLKTEQAEEKFLPLASPSISKIPDIHDSKSLMPEIGAPLIAKVETEPARTIVVTVESESADVEDKRKNSRLSKVFRQLKNVRAGEKVDWDEVGFNPKTLVARVDDRLHNKEEKGSENYQNPKDRTKL